VELAASILGHALYSMEGKEKWESSEKLAVWRQACARTSVRTVAGASLVVVVFCLLGNNRFIGQT